MACGNLVLDLMLKTDDGIEDVSLGIRDRKRREEERKKTNKQQNIHSTR